MGSIRELDPPSRRFVAKFPMCAVCEQHLAPGRLRGDIQRWPMWTRRMVGVQDPAALTQTADRLSMSAESRAAAPVDSSDEARSFMNIVKQRLPSPLERLRSRNRHGTHAYEAQPPRPSRGIALRWKSRQTVGPIAKAWRRLDAALPEENSNVDMSAARSMREVGAVAQQGRSCRAPRHSRNRARMRFFASSRRSSC